MTKGAMLSPQQRSPPACKRQYPAHFVSLKIYNSLFLKIVYVQKANAANIIFRSSALTDLDGSDR